MADDKKISVLFVCLGNICRSPMAEAIFRHKVRHLGIEGRFRIDSAGTGDWHVGQPPHLGTRKILDEYGISHEGQRARQVASADFSDYDCIVAMDSQNEADLNRLGKNTGAKIIKLLDLLPEVALADVPDPYYTGNFQEVYELVDKGCDALLEYLGTNK
ncbi:low molecular weight protein-tyrosine-phosphatase [Paenibacillus contaminans]|uniref:protein-tyrosine-phosphatase n=1 Tax=Paenibacillus contaminans TaxID=450362 RepID=A0A329MXP1_9BACL|nr:low molecular weight protein-tyrosine-phosphatase [Paenibacillus contaminans]RAV23123.1 low molecular weight phosphotyrosine protein phosphatase [Paenibacillus contaminans]